MSTLTPQVSGNHKFRLNSADDQAWVWLDLDQDGNLSSTGTGGDEKLIRANQEFGPADVSTPDIPLVDGQQYKFALISSNYGGGGKFRPWVQTPGGSMEVINPSAPSQAGLFSVVELSNGQPLSSQSLLEANVSGLVPGASYFYRVRATNSLGDYWAGSTSSFVAAHPLEFNATLGPLAFSEKQPIGSIVGNFEAMDANATLTYAFTEGFPKKVFELNGTYLAGEIVEANGSLWRVKTSLAPNGVFDSNSIFTYGMAARVSDGNGSFFESAIDFSSISAWDRYRSYALNELVSYNGNLYLSNVGSGNSARTPGVHPYWTLQDVGLAGTYWTPIGSKTQLGGEFWEAYLSPYDNHLFTLDANGTLRTTTTFDYESDATSYIIRVQVRDEHNASLDRNFTVSLNELYEPSRSNHLVDLNSTVNLEMIWVEPGTFTMGSPVTETVRQTDETEHNVTLTKGFYLGKYEVTQAQYKSVMKGNSNGLSANPSQNKGNLMPVEKVSWEDIQIFLHKLNSIENAAGRIPIGWKYMLPTEAQWEYACRAGTQSSYSWGDDFDSSKANYNWDNDWTTKQTFDVGQYAANPWGFYDMHGNVYEWTANEYQPAYPTDSPAIDPVNPGATGSIIAIRGGSWNANRAWIRSATRSARTSSERTYKVGFRLSFGQITTPPTDLNSTAPLTIAENQPVGTFVGQFMAHDPDANASLSYRLANGAGSQHNNRFSLDANGTLRTAKVFDYENRTTFKIRVQVADEHNVSIQEAFIVSVTDLAESNATTPDGNRTQVLPIDSNATNPDANATQPGVPVVELFQPIVETGEAKKVQKDSATLRGSLLDNGGARIIGRGFLLSERPNPKPGRKNITRLDSNGSKNFQAQATELKAGKKYFYRAFATNAQGTALGSVESFTTIAGPPSPSWINAQPGAAANWWTSPWFGNFYLNANGWPRHEQLGWVFPMESPTAGLWLWKRDLGWLWTDKEIYPFLYQNIQGGWLYFYGQRKGTLLFYDYEAKRWISKEDRQ